MVGCGTSPVAGYLLPASVIARRTPLLYAALPVIAGLLVETLILGPLQPGNFPEYEFRGFVIQRLFNGGYDALPNLLRSDGNHLLPFKDPALWIGGRRGRWNVVHRYPSAKVPRRHLMGGANAAE